MLATRRAVTVDMNFLAGTVRVRFPCQWNWTETTCHTRVRQAVERFQEIIFPDSPRV